ncbi:protein kinase domain-containing protein [Streptomyces flavofungini]|uniref:non-specific serine/threonine protein kinase n=1 Tax=Streptomyces flavofungini TaxID=68200 RepID=A0ABS0WY64_9ACTN|nr:protein kinase [Streptomyces flavofungini]MBJ3805838.1 serine/threonine protein kinase [Streptomyces flavofungini]GHC75603.1 serine/threonine protein kinase [Streptomyces flavofungini]
MAQTQRAQGPSDPEASGGGMSDVPEMWGNGGLVGDGRYRLTRRLGRGGMAEVFAAEDVRLGRTVAVKLLRSDLAEDPVSKARFTREAQSVAGLNHHAVVGVYDSGEDFINGNSVPYIVMELVEGRTIRDLLINAEAPGPEQALIIVSGVLEALAYSHQHGIVHRDIKPANVSITHTGSVKVMDFGIARALHGAQSTMTQTGMVMGTPQYLSPEQALGKAVDHRSDLYATGCLLYELLALRPPFTGETPLSVVYQHVQDIPVPPSEVSDAAPPELDGLVMRSLAKDPDDRFQTAEEMRGLIQYGLQMLAEQGSHTGTWNTGPVELAGMHEGAHTPAMGVAGTTAMPHPGDSGTQAIPGPMLRPPGGDDGGFDGGHRNGGGGRGRGKVWILAVLAVIAIVAGVAFALSAGDDKGGKKDKTPTTPSTKQSQEKSPSKSKEEETPDGETQPGGDGSGGQTGDWTRPPTQDTQQPTQPTDPPTDPTDPPTDPTDPPTDPTDPPTDPTDPATEPSDPTDPTDDGGNNEGAAQGGEGDTE